MADSLLADFDFPWERKVKALSRGMRSSFGIVLGVAWRAEVALFDEPLRGPGRSGSPDVL